MSSPFPHDSDPAETSDHTRPCILLIEDNPADVLLVEHALKEHDVRLNLKVLHDGEEAIKFIDAIESGSMKCPVLVIMDLNLPKKSGHDVLRRMRSTGTCRDVPVVVLSSSNVPIDITESKRLGVTRHMQKPSNFEDFMRIGEVLKSLLPGQNS